MEMPPETAQKGRVATGFGNVSAQQCLDGAQRMVAFTNAAAMQGPLHHLCCVSRGSDEPVPGTCWLKHHYLVARQQQEDLHRRSAGERQCEP